LKGQPSEAFVFAEEGKSHPSIKFSCVHYCTANSILICNDEEMPKLIVVEKIDGNPVAWRCSICRQTFSVRGKTTTQQRLSQVTAAFSAHVEDDHKTEGAIRPMTFVATAS
jgi:hypothetical protein